MSEQGREFERAVDHLIALVGWTTQDRVDEARAAVVAAYLTACRERDDLSHKACAEVLAHRDTQHAMQEQARPVAHHRAMREGAEAEVERLREALKLIAIVDQGCGGNLSFQEMAESAMQQARRALEQPK